VGRRQVFSRGSRFAGLTVALVAVALGTGPDAAQAMAATHTTTAGAAQQSCTHERVAGAGAAYGWPLKPFHRQHPVRGYFGDPRIGHGEDGTVSRSFHFGVDVSGRDGTPVYATGTGTVRAKKRSVAIHLDNGLTFAYWHIVPTVSTGQRVVAYRTVIGHIARGWGHVHFAEWRGGSYVNPLRPGAMGPYSDRTCPAATRLSFERGGESLEADALAGSFDVVVEAADAPALSAAAPWFQLPVTPAVVRWRIVDEHGGVVVPWRAHYDVRQVLPRVDYHAVYAQGTTQNHPDAPGLYRFQLARNFVARSLHSGAYAVQVVLVDSRGNRTHSAWPFGIAA